MNKTTRRNLTENPGNWKFNIQNSKYKIQIQIACCIREVWSRLLSILMSCSIFLIFCLISGPDLFVSHIIFSKPTILQVSCRNPISILNNLCPWHSAVFAVVVLLFDWKIMPFLLVCMPSLWLYVVCGVLSPKSRHFCIQVLCLIFLMLFSTFRANEMDFLCWKSLFEFRQHCSYNLICNLFSTRYVQRVVCFLGQQSCNRPNYFPT